MKQGRLRCAVSTHKSLPQQRTVHRFALRALNPQGQVSLLLLPLIMGIAMYFLREILLKVFASGQPDVRSGTSMTTRWVVSANMDSGYPGNQNCMTKHGYSYPQIVYWLGVSVVWNYPRGWAYLKCSRSSRNWWSSSFLSACQIAQNQKFSKIFSTKNTSQYAWLGEEIRNWQCPKDLALSWWISARFFDATEICELRLHTVTCLASPGKQHRKNVP